MARARFQRTLRVLSLLVLTAGCGAAERPAPKRAIRTLDAPKAQAPDARRLLLSALREIERPGAVLEALPPETKSTLETHIDALDASQRTELQTGSGGLAELLPLLHVAAGGESPQALFALATSSRGAEGMPALATSESKTTVVAELARRAGLHFLRDRTSELASPVSTTPALCRAIDQVASALGRRDLVRKSRELWVTLEPTPTVWLRVARARALDLDVEGAQTALARAEAAPGVVYVEKLVAAAVALAAPRAPVQGLESALSRARAELALERWPEAMTTLAAYRESADRHLGLAAALSLAETKSSPCPGLAQGLGSQSLCAAAWQNDASVKTALERLGRAFDSKAGRDAEALETYLGLVHIIPWIHASGTASGMDPEAAARAFVPRLGALKAALAEVPHLSHVGVFVDALALGYAAAIERKPGEPPRIPKAERDKLRSKALASPAPIAKLAAAAILSGEEDVADLVMASSASGLSTSQKSARAGILAWIAASGQHPEAVEPARAALADVAFEFREDDMARAETVLLLAEFDAARDPSERNNGVLAKVSTELISGAVTAELGLRAVLDAAGALVAMGRAADARKILEQAQGVAPMPGPTTEILALISGYLAVLKAEAGPSSGVAAFKREIAALSGPGAPPSIDLVLARWVKRLEALEAEASCQRKKAPNCAALASKLRQHLPKAVVSRISPDTVALFQKSGVLRTTRAGLRLGYAPETGVLPEVSFAPSFLKLD